MEIGRVLATQVPFLAPTLINSDSYDWNYTTVNQTGLGGRSIAYPRGRILGGCSSTSEIQDCHAVSNFDHNASDWLVYTRGSSDDFDRYATVTGDQGWSWNNILPYFKKNEKWNVPIDNHTTTCQLDSSINGFNDWDLIDPLAMNATQHLGGKSSLNVDYSSEKSLGVGTNWCREKWNLPTDDHNTTGQFDPSVHGFDGLVGVSLPSDQVPIGPLVINTTQELGGEFSFNVDFNSGKPLGVGWVQTTILGGQRSSSSTAYLAPQFLKRPNLTVLVNAQVSRLPRTSKEGIPAFLRVEFRGSDGVLKRLKAKKEVILSAGAIGTPHILLNSGIGSSPALKAVGVTPLVDLPDVGINLSDHPAVGNLWLVKGNNTYDTIRRNPDPALAQWQASNSGPYSDPVLNHIGFFRMPQVLVPSHDTSAGPNSPHFEITISNGVPFFLPPQGNFLTLTTIVVSPSSRGSIKLQSSNPFDAPLIDPGLLKTDFDKLTMREAIKSAIKFVSAPVWNDYIVGQASGLSTNETDAALDEYAAANAVTVFHPVGTASMSRKGAPDGVVDPDLKLKKVSGVRVVDASVLPYVPSAHTVAPVYAVAERAADIIKSSY
ncbi:hypothetical protein C0995_014473 [Termitomyces sp. Mi166|nr:hypothetical protein C0995_014473 [Termitomyces sp. Mi166\